MDAIIVDQQTKSLVIDHYPDPIIDVEDVLIENRATSVNRMDILQKYGKYPVPKEASQILGVDCAGTVIKVGKKVSKFKIGDEVFGLLQGGGYAQLCSNHQDLLWHKPPNLSFEQACSIPEVFLTAYQALFSIGSVEAHKSVLIHAGASGVGNAALQLCQLIGNKPYFTAGSEEKIQFSQKYGEAIGINYKKEDFSDVINRPIDLILDFVGKDYFHKNLKLLNQDGKLIIISFLSGAIVNELDLSLILRKWIKIEGTTLRSRSLDYRIKLI